MKVFFQAIDESLIIDGDISVTVLGIDGDEVLLGIDAPDWLQIEEKDAPQLQSQGPERFAALRPR